MKTFKIIVFALVIIFQIGCSPKLINEAGVKISSFAPVNPLMKRLDVNPVLRIAVEIDTHDELNFREIEFVVGSGLEAIQKLEVFFSDTTASFKTSNKIASISPSANKLKIPIDLKLKRGLHYIWISAVLKENANPDQWVELTALALLDKKNNKHRIRQESTTYRKRIGVAVRKSGDDNVDTYRIPGITKTEKGTLIAVYDIRHTTSKDLPGNIDVGMSRSIDGGKTWQPMKIIIDMGSPHENNGVGDPAILFDPFTKKIWVAALWSKGNRSIDGSKPGMSPDTTGQLVLVSSNDDGLTWSKPYSITPQVKDPVWHLFFNGPGNGTSLKDGKIVFPAQYWDENKMPHSTIVYSDDHGNTWKRGSGAKSNTTESQVVETTPGTLMLNMRDNRGKFRSVATTKDMGKTWMEHETSYSALPDPVCMASIEKMNLKVNGSARDLILFSNPATSSARYNITIKASLDLGETWPVANQLLVDERLCFGYSVLTKIDDETVGLLYEGTKNLYFVRIPINEILR